MKTERYESHTSHTNSSREKNIHALHSRAPHSVRMRTRAQLRSALLFFIMFIILLFYYNNTTTYYDFAPVNETRDCRTLRFSLGYLRQGWAQSCRIKNVLWWRFSNKVKIKLFLSLSENIPHCLELRYIGRHFTHILFTTIFSNTARSEGWPLDTARQRIVAFRCSEIFYFTSDRRKIVKHSN